MNHKAFAKGIALFFSVLLLSLLCSGIAVCAVSESAGSCILMAENGEVLYEKDADRRRGMASTTKIMTALLAIEAGDLDREVRVSPFAVGVEGSSVYLTAGETITMRNLLYALMLASANDAATAIAVEMAGSVPDFVDRMNEKAASLGLTDTHFDNPHGLDGKTHYTTARELCLLALYAMKNPVFRELSGTKKCVLPLHDGSASRLLVNHNRLLRTYDDVCGVKTGFTKACGRTLVSAAERDGLMLFCVTLNDANDWKDHRALLDYGFSLLKKERLADAGSIGRTVPVCGGVSQTVTVSNPLGAEAVLKNGHEPVEMVVYLPSFLYAGFEAGEKVGEVLFFCDGKEIARIPLVTNAPVGIKKEKSFLFSFFHGKDK